MCVCVYKQERDRDRQGLLGLCVCACVYTWEKSGCVFSPEYSVEQVVRVNARTCSCLRNISL